MKRIFCLILLAVSMSACVYAPTVTEGEGLTGEAFSNNTQLLMRVNNWGLSGRMAISHPKDSWQASLNWQHSPIVDALMLSSGLTGTMAEIQYSNGVVLLKGRDGVNQLNGLADLEAEIGFSPPLDHMPYWVRGLISPNKESAAIVLETSLDEAGYLQIIHQYGWRVTLQRYQKVGYVWLPHKIKIERENLKIKLVVDQWVQ